MKKWGFFLAIIFFLLIAINQYLTSNKANLLRDDIEYANEENENNDFKPIPSNRNLSVEEDMINDGQLLLVNEEHPLKKNTILDDVVNVFEYDELEKEFGLIDANIELSIDLLYRFNDMIHAANKEGDFQFLLTSGYRSWDAQQTLYQEKGADYALPAGYSEHNFGLALDVGSQTTTMYKAKEAQWLEEKAWMYGFILRYPENKSDITGISYEPWHIRYVGLPHSAVMHEKNLVLEEYLKLLETEKTIDFTLGDVTYHIQYFPVHDANTISLPDDDYYHISGDNKEGVIVTTYSL